MSDLTLREEVLKIIKEELTIEVTEGSVYTGGPCLYENTYTVYLMLGEEKISESCHFTAASND